MSSQVFETVLRLIEGDSHSHGKRACETCRAVSIIANRPFGCFKKAGYFLPGSVHEDYENLREKSFKFAVSISEHGACSKRGLGLCDKCIEIAKMTDSLILSTQEKRIA